MQDEACAFVEKQVSPEVTPVSVICVNYLTDLELERNQSNPRDKGSAWLGWVYGLHCQSESKPLFLPACLCVFPCVFAHACAALLAGYILLFNYSVTIL